MVNIQRLLIHLRKLIIHQKFVLYINFLFNFDIKTFTPGYSTLKLLIHENT